MDVYVIPQNGTKISFPFHKLYVLFAQNDGIALPLSNIQLVSTKINVTGSPVSSATIVDSSSEVLVAGPGLLKVLASGDIPFMPAEKIPVTATAFFKTAARDSQRIGTAVDIPYSSGNSHNRQWIYGPLPPWKY